MGLIDIHKYPLVRILIPFLGGILLADYGIESLLAYQSWFFLGLIGFFFVLLVIHLKLKAYTQRYWFGLVLSLALVLLGVCRTLLVYPAGFFVVDSRPQLHCGELVAAPIVREAGTEYFVQNRGNPSSISLFVPSDSLGQSYETGDIIAYYARLTKPDSPLFRYEFNYRKYLQRKGIQASAYVKGSDVFKLGRVRDFNLEVELSNYRQGLLEQFRELGLEGDVLSIVAALTLGVKSELSSDLKEAFSMAGVSHVLALSGLHIGLLYALTQLLLLKFLHGRKRKEVWALMATLALLWLFALFVGGSASVIRSVLLFSLLGLSRILNRQGNGINSLALVALMMLLYRPNWLFDVGFQLSFVAVAGILIFSKPLSAYYKAKTKLGQYIWNSIVISTVAQFATAPLILYYFSSFSVYFLLANLIVIPLVTLLLYSLILLLLSLRITFVAVILAQWVDLLTGVLVCFVRWVSKLRGASIEGVSIYPYEFIVFIGLGITFFILLKTRCAKSMLWLLSFVAIGLLMRVYQLSTHRPVDKYSLTLVDDRLVVSCCGRNAKVWVIPSDSLVSPTKLANKYKKEWMYHNYREVQYLKENSTSDALFWDGCVIYYRGQSLALLSQLQEDRWNGLACHFDYIYLDRNTKSNLEQMISLHTPKGIIVHPYLAKFRKMELKQLCKENNIDYLILKSKGYIDLLL